MNRPETIHPYLLTVVTPTHNAIGKFERTVSSLEELSDKLEACDYALEVIHVDDSSTDGTYEELQRIVANRPNWKVETTKTNSGSPSVPRNIGIDQASGEYIFFLDGDDEIHFNGIKAALDIAAREHYDLVRAPVEVYYQATGRRVVIDQLPDQVGNDADTMVEAIARHQSLNCSALWRSSILKANNLRFDPEARMGEDLKFTAEAMSLVTSIGYVKHPMFTYVRHEGGGGSAMHHFGGRELREIVESWDRVENEFKKRNLSYLKLHGDRTVNYAIQKIIRHHFRSEITDFDIATFAEFFDKHRDVLRSLHYADPHVNAFVDAMCVRGQGAFDEVVKPRLLIAGSDLKFILPAVTRLREYFDVRVDEWPSEVTHNQSQSSSLLGWADYVWVEWLTSAAVWYSQRIARRQRLVVRMHRYELGRQYGDIISADRVDAFVAIAPHCLEDMIERFNYPRSKVRYIPNYYIVDDYDVAQSSDSDRVYRLAMIGAIPKRKGLLPALEILRQLRQQDDRYTLSLLGKAPEELPWIGSDPYEQQYFAACEKFIEDDGLGEYVRWLGWQDTRRVSKDYGFVLSMSEHEGSHVGPGEAFCSGNQGVFLNWRGAEFVYPEEQVFNTIEQIRDHILSMSNIDDFNTRSQEGREFMKSMYDIELFVDRVTGLFKELP